MARVEIHIDEINLKSKSDVLEITIPGDYYLTLDGAGLVTIEGGKTGSYEYVEIDLKKRLKKAQKKSEAKSNSLVFPLGL